MSVTIEALEAARDTLNFTAQTLRERFTVDTLTAEMWQCISRAEEDSHGCKIALFELKAVDSVRPDWLDYVDGNNDICAKWNEVAELSLMTVLNNIFAEPAEKEKSSE